MSVGLILFTTSLVFVGPPAGTTSAGVTLPHCLVSLIDDVRVPAQEAGVLVALEAREGMQVEAGMVLGRINDSQSQMAKRVAVAEQQIAVERAANDVDIRFAEAAAKVAEFEHRANWEANVKVPGTKPATELQRLLLAHRKAELAIEQAQHARKISELESQAKAAQVDVADDEIARRQIIAPLAGEVVEVFQHVGEWVQPGDQVLRVVRLDRLRVEGFLNAADYSPQEVAARPVRVQVRLARGRVELFEGKLVHVSPLVQAGGEYRVWAEVVNRAEQGRWLLRPGTEAEMTIYAE